MEKGDLIDATEAQGQAHAPSPSQGGPVALVSHDGVSWVQVPLQTNLAGVPIAYGNGFFVIGSITLKDSADGLIWSKRVGPAQFADLAFGHGTFVGVASAGTIFQSDPIVHLTITRGAATQVSGAGLADRSYRIEYSDDLNLTNGWQVLTNFHSPSDAFSVVDPTSSRARIYRAVVLP